MAHGIRSKILFAASCGVVFSSGALAVAQEPLRSYEGLWSRRGIRPDFDRMGDIDGDGHWDLIVEEDSWSGGGFDNAGRVQILSGATGRVLEVYQGSQRFENLGGPSVGLPDVDGDGVADYAIDSRFEGVVYSGRNHRRLFTNHDFFQVVSVGDRNDDGIDDLLMSQVAAVGGRVHVYLGKTFQKVLTVTTSASFAYYFGWSIVAIDDLDGDGVKDFAVGSPGRGDHSFDVGRVEVFSGRDGRRMYELMGPAPVDLFGFQLAAPGDLTGDGVGDLAVASSCCGLFFYDGPTGKRIGRIERVGVVSSVGDVNGNGFGDVLVGVYPREDTISVGVVDGKTRTMLYEIPSPYGPVTDAVFGWVLSEVGDADGDEVPDLLVGTSGASSELRRIDLYSGMLPGHRIYGEGCPIPMPAVPEDPWHAPPEPGAGPPDVGMPPYPRIGADPVELGDGVARIHVSRLAPDLAAFLVVGLQPAPGEPGRFAGCPVHVTWEAVYGVTTQVIRPGEGGATVEVPLPPELTNATLHAQWFVRHPRTGAHRTMWSSSRAIAVDIPEWGQSRPGVPR